MTTVYRVRHPAAPDLFVWMAGSWNTKTMTFERPLIRHKAHGAFGGEYATVTITFTPTHSGYATREEAEDIAKFVGGTAEEVKLP